MDGGVDLDRIGSPNATHRAEQLLGVISDVDAGTTGTDRRRHQVLDIKQPIHRQPSRRIDEITDGSGNVRVEATAPIATRDSHSPTLRPHRTGAELPDTRRTDKAPILVPCATTCRRAPDCDATGPDSRQSTVHLLASSCGNRRHRRTRHDRFGRYRRRPVPLSPIRTDGHHRHLPRRDRRRAEPQSGRRRCLTGGLERCGRGVPATEHCRLGNDLLRQRAHRRRGHGRVAVMTDPPARI